MMWINLTILLVVLWVSTTHAFVGNGGNAQGGVKGMRQLSSLGALVKKTAVPLTAEDRQKLSVSLVKDIVSSSEILANQVVSSFLKNMPAEYFKDVPEAVWMQHLKSIVANHGLSKGMEFDVSTSTTPGSMQHTYFSSDVKSGNLLRNHLHNLHVPVGYELSGVKSFKASDGSFVATIFYFEKSGASMGATTPSATPVMQSIQAYALDVKNGAHKKDDTAPQYSELLSATSLQDYAKLCPSTYIEGASCSPRRFLLQREMYAKICNSDGSTVHAEADEEDAKMSWVTVAAANVPADLLMRMSADIVATRGVDIAAAYVSTLSAPETSSAELPGTVTMLRMKISSSKKGTDLSANSVMMKSLLKDLKRSKWLDPKVLDLGLVKFPALGTDKAEIIVALASMLHGPLAKIDAAAFHSIPALIDIISGNPANVNIASALAEALLNRFNPAIKATPKTFESKAAALRDDIKALPLESARTLLNKMVEAAEAVRRLNFFNEDRYALSLRMDPSIMVSTDRAMPFGVFFMHGRHFNGFHNRFRDIARGGLRVVTPLTSDQYSLESTRQYDEAYGLSYAQQLKNKDIPEGGAKGVILVNTPAIPEHERFAAMRTSVKAYCDSMLDLMVQDSVKGLVDLYKKEEIVYLGPDEQIIPSDIEWIIKRATQRGYPNPAAFMSSKKLDGFNHKEFGVTSEGVVVFLDIALRKVLNINPQQQSFSIKITGGPDGDVAGNLMKVLFRDYGDKPKVLGVSDGFGVAEDPEGLDHAELLRLFNEGKSIVHFDKSKLSKHGVHMDVSTKEGVERRNSMHFRIKADVFVPGGGRPNTINGANWQKFLLPDGSPSSKLVVEGANIFTTPEARKALFEHSNVTFVKDSSANKCGVITSSCEIQASMLLSKEEFMANKPALVHDLIERLRLLARLEGELLFKEFQNQPGSSLVQFSERISNAIAKVTDAVTDRLADVKPGDALFVELLPVIRENLPKKLAELGGDRIAKNYPVQYQRNAIASGIAARLVYQEGINLVEAQPMEKLADRAIAYYISGRKLQTLLSKLENQHFGENASIKPQVLDILRKGGARTMVEGF